MAGQRLRAGLADGYYLVGCKSSDSPCLLQLDDWEVHLPDPAVDWHGTTGYIAKTFNTWGPQGFENRNWDCHVPQRPLEGRQFEGSIPLSDYAYEQLTQRDPRQIRINLKLLLRDRKTIKYYHFDVGNLVWVYRNEYALRIDLMDGFDGQPDLPYVEPYNGMGFDGVVVPWEDGEKVDVGF